MKIGFQIYNGIWITGISKTSIISLFIFCRNVMIYTTGLKKNNGPNRIIIEVRNDLQLNKIEIECRKDKGSIYLCYLWKYRPQQKTKTWLSFYSNKIIINHTSKSKSFRTFTSFTFRTFTSLMSMIYKK